MSKLKLFVLFSIACGQVFGQGERATISGTVTDSTGAVVPQVRVTVRNERTNIVNKAESNSTGLFVVPALQPGAGRNGPPCGPLPRRWRTESR